MMYSGVDMFDSYKKGSRIVKAVEIRESNMPDIAILLKGKILKLRNGEQAIVFYSTLDDSVNRAMVGDFISKGIWNNEFTYHPRSLFISQVKENLIDH